MDRLRHIESPDNRRQVFAIIPSTQAYPVLELHEPQASPDHGSAPPARVPSIERTLVLLFHCCSARGHQPLDQQSLHQTLRQYTRETLTQTRPCEALLSFDDVRREAYHANN